MEKYAHLNVHELRKLANEKGHHGTTVSFATREQLIELLENGKLSTPSKAPTSALNLTPTPNPTSALSLNNPPPVPTRTPAQTTPPLPTRAPEPRPKAQGQITLEHAIAEAISPLLNFKPELDEARVKALIQAELGNRTACLTITTPNSPSVSINNPHKDLAEVCKYISLKKNIFLVGPAGTGKTTLARQLAQALSLEFIPDNVSPDTTRTDFLGYRSATTGEYFDTAFRRAFEHGGLYLLDEIDRGPAGTLTVLNSALDNGFCTFPDRTVERHPDFRAIAAGNTFGKGNDLQYVGAAKIDEATRNRFLFFPLYYDTDLELALTSNSDITRTLHKIRQTIETLKLKVIVSTRNIRDIHDLIHHAQVTLERALDLCIFGGVPEDQKAKILTTANVNLNAQIQTEIAA
ncbi:MAG: AAA family ATPase [Candidatus Zixiibacteriota bacterium]|nr:MAG: AAA family ATPase [candidate division Zixibacteria bacterium]